MKMIKLTRDTNYSFLKTTYENGYEFTRKLEKGSVDYSNACVVFHANNVELVIGNSVTK